MVEAGLYRTILLRTQKTKKKKNVGRVLLSLNNSA